MDFGNPGKEYEKTRHNVGFRVIDHLASEYNISVNQSKFDAIVGEGMMGTQKVLLVKPETYMNLSGQSVKAIVDFYKLDLNHLIVIYDDIDISLGQIRVRNAGSPGTHNGMRNIVQMLSSENFPRIRVGTEKPKYTMNLADYVLMPFPKEEIEVIQKGIEAASKAALKIIEDGIQSAMNEFNRK